MKPIGFLKDPSRVEQIEKYTIARKIQQWKDVYFSKSKFISYEIYK